MTKASLFTRSSDGRQAWPENGTIKIPARCKAETVIHPRTGDMVILADDVALYVPRGGSVVIEAVAGMQGMQGMQAPRIAQTERTTQTDREFIRAFTPNKYGEYA